jgi:hypothetical protein
LTNALTFELHLPHAQVEKDLLVEIGTVLIGREMPLRHYGEVIGISSPPSIDLTAFSIYACRLDSS